MDNQSKIELLYNDLGEFVNGSDYDGNLEYAYNNGYKLHACSLYLSTGAVSDAVLSSIKGVVIDRDLELKEIEHLLGESHDYECKGCNHIGMYEEDQGKSITCMGCHGNSLKRVELTLIDNN